MPDYYPRTLRISGGVRMRNHAGKGLDVGFSHHRGKYCGYAGEYRRDVIQYLCDHKEIIHDIKKDR